MNPRTHQLSMDLLLLLVTFFWGMTFIVVKKAVAHADVFPFLTARFGLAFLFMAAFTWKSIRTFHGPTMFAGSLLGMVLFGAFAFQTWGLTLTSATHVGFFTGLNVVMVPILSLILLKRPPAPFATVGVVLASLGLYFLTGGGPAHWSRGDFLAFICAVWVAFHILLTGHYAPRHDPLVLATWQLGTVAVLSLAFSIAEGSWTLGSSGPVWGAVIVTAIFCTVFAFGAQTYAQRFTSPTRTALIFTGEPVFGALFAHWYGGEVLLGQHMLGGALIFLGMVMAEVRPRVKDFRAEGST